MSENAVRGIPVKSHVYNVTRESNNQMDIMYSRKKINTLTANELAILQSATITPKDLALLIDCTLKEANELLEAFPSRKRYCTTRRETSTFLIALVEATDIPYLYTWISERSFYPLECYNFGIYFNSFNFIPKD